MLFYVGILTLNLGYTRISNVFKNVFERLSWLQNMRWVIAKDLENNNRVH
jgi:hypothetical protein